MSSIATMNQEEIRNRLVELGNAYGPEILTSRHNVLSTLAVDFLRKAALEADPVVRMDRLCQADRYMSMAQVVVRADELDINREAMLIMLEQEQTESMVPLNQLRNHSRQPHFKTGDVVYLRSESVPVEGEEVEVGFMEVVICGMECTFDSASYLIGFLEPVGDMVSISDEWVDEAELTAQIPEDDEGPRPVKARPHLKIVK